MQKAMPLATGAAGPATAGLVQNPRRLRIKINTGHHYSRGITECSPNARPGKAKI